MGKLKVNIGYSFEYNLDIEIEVEPDVVAKINELILQTLAKAASTENAPKAQLEAQVAKDKEDV